MKIIIFATSEFAIPSLKKLVEAGYDIAAVVTQPDKRAGRKQTLSPSPIKLEAQKLGLKIFQPKALSIEHWTLGIPDVNIAASYGKIIPRQILDIPRFGSLNIHPSLLPKYRGPSPIHAAILNGEVETGVTIIKLDAKMDHGPMLANSEFKIQDSKFYFKDLHDKLAELGAKLLIKILPGYIAGKIRPVPQDHSKATFTKLVTKDDACIDWNLPAEKIWSMVRAYHLWPVAWTIFNGKRLKIFSASPSPDERKTVRRGGPGEVAIGNNKISVQTGLNSLDLKLLQLEGGKIMTAEAFLHGHPRLDGMRLG